MSTIAREYIKVPTASLSITSNNTYDVTEKAQVVVNVPNPSTGKIEITTTSETDVTDYATAQVVDSDLVAANIKSGVDILGVTGTASTIDIVSSVPSTKSTEIIYNTGDSSYYIWKNLLCFTANTAGSTIAMSVSGTATLGQNFSYSTDGDNWVTFVPGTTTVTLTNSGDKVYFKGNNPNGVSEYNNATYTFVMTGSIAASGNIMSLIDNGACNTTTIPNSWCFYNMFANCTSLTLPPELPATTLTGNCYQRMFFCCTSLATAPELPATYVAGESYEFMFYGCTSLVNLPTDLPFTTVDTYGCYYMFKGCTALTVPAKLHITTFTDDTGLWGGCRAMYKETGIKVNNTGTGTLFFTCPSDIGDAQSVYDMFAETQGEYTSDPVAGGQYYYTI